MPSQSPSCPAASTPLRVRNGAGPASGIRRTRRKPACRLPPPSGSTASSPRSDAASGGRRSCSSSPAGGSYPACRSVARTVHIPQRHIFIALKRRKIGESSRCVGSRMTAMSMSCRAVSARKPLASGCPRRRCPTSMYGTTPATGTPQSSSSVPQSRLQNGAVTAEFVDDNALDAPSIARPAPAARSCP